MKHSVRKSLGGSLFIALILAALVSGCTKRDADSGRTIVAADEGIPEPPAGLTDASPVTAFKDYAATLSFSVDGTPGALLVNRPIPGGTSQLRVRSETRLPLTAATSYTRGRIIAVFETITAGSAYNTPVGNAYLWVRDTGNGNFVGTLMYTNAATGDTGRVTVPSMMHSAPRAAKSTAECVNLDFSSDTTRLCCMCGGGQWNCPFSAVSTMQQLEALLTNAGQPPR